MKIKYTKCELSQVEINSTDDEKLLYRSSVIIQDLDIQLDSELELK